MRYAQGQLGICFGPDREVVRTYHEVVQAFRALAVGRRSYRSGSNYETAADELQPQMDALDKLHEEYLRAAHMRPIERT